MNTLPELTNRLCAPLFAAMSLAIAAFVLMPTDALAQTTTADAAHEATTAEPAARTTTTLSAFAGTGFLGSIGPTAGGTFELGVRLGIGQHFALGTDVGYGVLGTGSAVQDRWWIMPSAAYVVPVGRLRLEFGAGLGLGAASGYTSASAFVDAPFVPTWAYQLVPAVRAHWMATLPVSGRVSVFARVDAGSLLLDAGSIARPVGNHPGSVEDTTWITCLFGVHYRLF